MARSTPSSRDNFPINAFVLLPPLAAHNSDILRDPQQVTPASADALEGEKSDADVDTLPWNIMQFKRTHSDIRSAIESLYRQNGQNQRENTSLRHEKSVLVESQQRAKEEAAKTEQKLRNQLQKLDYEAAQLQEKLHATERAKERGRAENEELQAKVEEQQATITELQDAMKEIEQRCHVRDASSCEVGRLEDLWASREQWRTEKAVQRQQNMKAVQLLAETLRKQIELVQKELQSTEKDYGAFRRFLADHKRLGDGQLQRESSEQDDHKNPQLEKFRTQMQKLTEQNLELDTHNKVLLTKCSEYEKSVRLLNRRLDEFNTKQAACATLLTKYEASAADGTQTIADLQESLVKLCDQLSEERQSHQSRLQEQLRATIEKENGLQDELSKMKHQLREMCEQLDDAKHVGERETPSCKSCQRDRGVVDHLASPSREAKLLSPTPDENRSAKRCQESQSHRPFVSVIVGSDRDEIEDDNDIPPLPSPRPLPRENRDSASKGKRRVETAAATACRLCNEEPFGFMVRCQKCKDPFHAGCVKNSASGTKKKLGYIFKCSNCAPQRPTKVARVAAAPSVQNSSATPAKTAIPTPTPTPESMPRIIARPAPPNVES